MEREEAGGEGGRGRRVDIFKFPSNINILRFLDVSDVVQSIGKPNLGMRSSANNFLFFF